MNLLDSAIEWFQGIKSDAGSVVQEWSSEWDTAVNAFKERAKEFVNLFDKLRARENVAKKDPDTKNTYDKLMSKGDWIYAQIESLAHKMDYTIDSILYGNTQKLNGMGGFVLISVAVIGAAIAVIVAWLSDAYQLDRKLDHIEELEKKGFNPVEVSKAMNNNPPTLGGTIQNVGKTFLWLTAGYMVYKNWGRIKKVFG